MVMTQGFFKKKNAYNKLFKGNWDVRLIGPKGVTQSLKAEIAADKTQILPQRRKCNQLVTSRALLPLGIQVLLLLTPNPPIQGKDTSDPSQPSPRATSSLNFLRVSQVRYWRTKTESMGYLLSVRHQLSALEALAHSVLTAVI